MSVWGAIKPGALCFVSFEISCLLYSFSNVCRDFTICFPQNILDQGDIQMRDLKFLMLWLSCHFNLQLMGGLTV